MNAKFYFFSIVQTKYLFTWTQKIYSNAYFHISADSCQLFEQMSIKYLLGGRHGYGAQGYEAKEKSELWSNHEAEAKSKAFTFWKHKAEAKAEALEFSKHETEVANSLKEWA